MLGCSVAVSASRLRQYILILAGCWLTLVFLLLPLAGISYLWAGLILTLWFYSVLRAWSPAFQQAVLCIDDVGAIAWQQTPLVGGLLSHRCLISHWVLIIEWLDSDGRAHRYWLFKDQLTASDYRALARQLQIQCWRGPALKPQ